VSHRCPYFSVRISSFVPKTLISLCLVSAIELISPAPVLAQAKEITSSAAKKSLPLFDSGQFAHVLLRWIWEGICAFWYVWVILAVIAVIRIAWASYRYRRLSRSGITEIDTMDGRTFEQFLETLFVRQGYSVELTPYRGDWGADLVLKRGEIKTVVQAKRYTKSVGIKAVQEVTAAKAKYRCTQAMVVTNSRFTPQAQELARVNDVVLWDRSELIQSLLDVKETGLSSGQGIASDKSDSPLLDTNNGICCVCGRSVSDNVKTYCQENSVRFGKRIYCFEHQKSIKYKPASF
jgi:restriction system protein